MELLGNTRELKIVMEVWKEQQKSKKQELKYPLYETNYVSGIKEIFKEAIRNLDNRDNEEKSFFSEEKRNILTFVGKRGSGKTTAMGEFCEILDRLGDEKEKEAWIRETLGESEKRKLRDRYFKFYVLEPIDASLLGAGEDLFELILASIYRKFKNKLEQKETYNFCEGAELQEIMQLFSEIFKSYRTIKGSKNEDEYGNCIVSKMQFMTGSQQLQEYIIKLVDKLLGSKDNCEYIVIPIDDLDLNLEHGYEMLEQLQKYFSYYRILILTALDFDQMSLVCEEYFRKTMENTTKAYEYIGREQSLKLASDYMTKIFHFSQCMYMPDMERLGRKAEIVIKERDDSEENKENRISAKKFIMNKIAESMYIFYDACGEQRHFSEQKTIRNLVSYNEFLESLNVIDFAELKGKEILEQLKEEEYETVCENNRRILGLYDQNHERFNQDINIRMTQNELAPFQKRAFDLLSKQPIERRAQHFINAERNDSKLHIGSSECKNYTYGKLLQKIYEWGRGAEGGELFVDRRFRFNTKKETDGEYLEDKPFIRCILASFTVELVREYLNYRYKPEDRSKETSNGKDEEKQKSIEKYKKRLLGVLGETFGSQWTGNAFPSVIIQINDLPKEYKFGYLTEMEQGALNIEIDVDNLKYDVENSKNQRQWRKAIENWFESEKIIESLEIIDMFFVKREGNIYKGLEYIFTYDYPVLKKQKGKKEDGQKEDSEKTEGTIEDESSTKNTEAQKVEDLKRSFRVSGRSKKITMDMMAFVAKSLNYKEEKERLQTNIINGLSEALVICLGYENNIVKRSKLKEIVKDEVEKRTLFAHLSERMYGEEVAFPFYNLDMTYNVFKRVKRDCQNQVYQEEKLLDAIKVFYKTIGAKLGEEKENYNFSQSFNYLDIYLESPYINAINNLEDDKVAGNILRAFKSITTPILEEIDNDRSILGWKA